MRTIAGVLSALDNDGATLEEVMFARSVLSEAAARDDDNYKMSNAEYVDKCVSAYLYGSNLASYAAVSSFFTGRRLDAGRERELLNRYVAAMLAPDRNLHLRISAPAQPDADRMKALFAEGWKQGSSAVSDIPVASDTLKLVSPRKKVKLKNTSTDAFSGGKMWTFSNGISVIYKKTADKGSFQYGFMVKGGWPEIPGIKGSEPAFAQDVIRLSKVGGMSATHLQDLLAMYGVTMEPQLSLTDVRLVGTAPTASLSLVLKTMLTVAGNTEPDPEAYSRYRKEKAVRLVRDKFSEEGTRAVLDSIMCPGYAYAAGSLPKPPAEGYEVRVNQYLTQKGSSFKNGVIVLIGDLNEGITLKLLTHCLGELKTGQQRASRPRMQYPLRECWTTNSVLRDWRSHGVSVSLSTLWPFGADGNIKLQLACALLQARLDEALCTDGMYSSVTAFSDLLPAEKLSVHIHCEPVLTSGLPADVKPAPPVHALQTVRSVINGLASTEVDAATLARAKTMLTNRFKAGENDPALLRDAVLWRTSLGRDLNSGYAQRLKAVKASEIRELFAALMKSDCEYVVQ